MTDTEFVRVEGNKISGSAIPVKIPYISRESDLLKPDNRSLLGINRTSMPASTVSRTLFRVRGTDIGKSFFKVLKNFFNSGPALGDWQKKVYLSR